jgi:uncharacterized protein (TIGR02611 family)
MDSGSHESLLVRFRRFTRLDLLPTGIRRLIVGVIGGTILLIGFALLFLPGPAVLVIPLGLAILATEFAWARYYLIKARKLFEKAKQKAKEKAARKRSNASRREKVNSP